MSAVRGRTMRGLVLSLTVAAGSLISGCGSTATKQPAESSAATPPAPTSPAASPSPTPSRTGPLPTGPGVHAGETPPALTDTGRANTTAGALAFAKFFFQAVDWSIATMDPYLIQKYSEPSCTGCTSSINMITNLTKTHGYVTGGRLSVGEIQLADKHFDLPSSFAVQVTLTQSAETVVSSPGATPSTAFSTAQTDNQWLLVDWIGSSFQVREIVGS
jgi:hypothetical protein